MIDLKLKNATLKIPETWSEVTWGQYKRLDRLEVEDGSSVGVVSAITGLDREFWTRYRDLGTYHRLAKTCNDLLLGDRPDPDTVERPDSILIDEVVIQLPNDLAYVAVGPYEDALRHARGLERAIKREDRDSLNDIFEIILAIYAQPILDRDRSERDGESIDFYDYRRVLEIVEEGDLDSVRYVDVLAWGYFFLRKISEYGIQLQDIDTNPLTRLRTLRRRFALACRMFWKTMVSG